jgi:phosphohistidine phosphatase SixA
MRHGEAGESPDGDAHRALTARGHAQAQTAARGLKLLGVKPQALWHSPYRRAHETAAIVGAALAVPLVVDDRLVPDADPDVAAAALWSEAGGALLVVAHLPVLPGIAHALGAGRLHLGTASVAHVVVHGGSGVIAGLWTSDQLGQLAGHEPPR